MNFLVIAFLFLAAHLFYLLSKSNPFDRCLKKRPYTVDCSKLNRYDITISFSKGATIDCLREAIFSAMYQAQSSAYEHRSPSISFDNFMKWNSVVDSFKPFHFSSISFEKVSSDHFQCGDFLLLPCGQLILPRRTRYIDLLGYSIPCIKEIVMPSESFVTLAPHSDYASSPFEASGSINIIVPQKFLSQYREDPVWSSLRFIDRDGNINSATFNGLAPTGPSKPKEEPIYYMEAASGMTVRVPESKLEAWQAEQDRIRNDPAAAELTEEEKKLRDAILHELYRKRYSAYQESDDNV